MLKQKIGGLAKAFLAIVLTAFLLSPSVAAAQTSLIQQLQAPFYDPGSSNSDISCSTTYSSVSASAAQADIIKIIIGIAKTDNLGKAGAVIGLMTADDESGFQIYANSTVPVSLSIPHQKVGNNSDSVGIFQQRPSTGWSTIATGAAADSNRAAVAQLMDPAYAAEAFFGSPDGANAPSALSKGLQNVSGWQSMQPWEAAQHVQASAYNGVPSPANNYSSVYGGNYKGFLSDAEAFVNQYWDSSPAVPLPVPINGTGSGGDNSTTGSLCSGSIALGSYKNPLRDVKQLRPERIDQGIDYAGEGPVYALGDGVIKNLTNPGWDFGGYDAFISEQLTDGPAKGLYVYMAEACVPKAGLNIGDTVNADTVICNMINPTSTGIETGWALPPGVGAAMASDVYREGDMTAFGVNYNELLVKLGAPSGIAGSGPAVGSLPPDWPKW